MRSGLMILLLSFALNGNGAAGCGLKQRDQAQGTQQSQNKNAAAAPVRGGGEAPVNVEVKVLAQGGHISVYDSLVAVVRDAGTYAVLRQIAGQLPEMNDEFFKSNIVVAAFLGQRRTGGYGIEITRAADGGVRVTEQSPPKDALVTQVLTTPFKIVSMPLTDDRPLSFALGSTWQAMTRPYRVTAGEFTTGGGIAGRVEKLRLEGDIRIMRQGRLATFMLDLKSAGGTKARVLREVATGALQPDGRIVVAPLDPGSLVDQPHEALRAAAVFTDNGDRLSLTFESLPTRIADGYSGAGTIEAEATAPPPRSKAIMSEETE